jgi:hypothetical protein
MVVAGSGNIGNVKSDKYLEFNLLDDGGSSINNSQFLQGGESVASLSCASDMTQKSGVSYIQGIPTLEDLGKEDGGADEARSSSLKSRKNLKTPGTAPKGHAPRKSTGGSPSRRKTESASVSPSRKAKQRTQSHAAAESSSVIPEKAENGGATEKKTEEKKEEQGDIEKNEKDNTSFGETAPDNEDDVDSDEEESDVPIATGETGILVDDVAVEEASKDSEAQALIENLKESASAQRKEEEERRKLERQGKRAEKREREKEREERKRKEGSKNSASAFPHVVYDNENHEHEDVEREFEEYEVVQLKGTSVELEPNDSNSRSNAPAVRKPKQIRAQVVTPGDDQEKGNSATITKNSKKPSPSDEKEKLTMGSSRTNNGSNNASNNATTKRAKPTASNPFASKKQSICLTESAQKRKETLPKSTTFWNSVRSARTNRSKFRSLDQNPPKNSSVYQLLTGDKAEGNGGENDI